MPRLEAVSSETRARRGSSRVSDVLPALSIGSGFVVVASLVAAGQAAPLAQRLHRSGIAGVVHDRSGAPLSLARIVADEDGRSAVTDDSGHFDLRGLAGGRNGFMILKIGFAAVSFEANLPQDSVVIVAVSMHRVRTLDTVDVRARVVQNALVRAGFEERRHLGLGSFLSPEQVDSMVDRVLTPSNFLRATRGIDLRCPRLTCVPVAHNSSTPCLQLFVDGVRIGPAEQLDNLSLSPYEIGAIEVYDRSTIVPAEFQAPPPIKPGRGLTPGSGCGAIVLWTKGWAGIASRRRNPE